MAIKNTNLFVKPTSDKLAIHAMIADVVVRSTQHRDDIQVTMVSCLMHAMEHGDVTYATRLVTDLGGKGKGNKTHIRSNAILEWFIKFGGMRWVADRDGTLGFKVSKDKMNALIVAYTADPATFIKLQVNRKFWVLIPEPEYKAIDLVKKIEALIKQAKKARDDEDEIEKALEAKVEHNLIGLDELEQVFRKLTTYTPVATVQ